MSTNQHRFSEADQLFARAMGLLHGGEIIPAADLFSTITDKFPEYGKAWCELGALLNEQLSDKEGAADCFKKCIEVNPAYSPAYLGYADILFETGKFAEANAILNQAMELTGVRKDLVLLKTALLMESQSRYDEAVATYKKAILTSFSESAIQKGEKGIGRCEVKKKYL